MPFLTPFRMAFSMTVRATNVAFIDFCLQRLPGVADANHPTDFPALFPANVVEVKAAGIGFATIDAWMQFQVIYYPLALFPPNPLCSLAGFANVIGLVSLIMHLNQLAHAFAAIDLTLPPAFILEIKFRNRLLFQTSRAFACGRCHRAFLARVSIRSGDRGRFSYFIRNPLPDKRSERWPRAKIRHSLGGLVFNPPNSFRC